MANINLSTGINTLGQIPTVAKEYVVNLAELTTLGINNQKAYSYYKGQLIHCAENGLDYRWREVIDEDEVGLLATHFTYPDGAIANGIDYSNKTYNLFKVASDTTSKVIYVTKKDLAPYTGTITQRIVNYVNSLNYMKEGDLWVEYDDTDEEVTTTSSTTTSTTTSTSTSTTTTTTTTSSPAALSPIALSGGYSKSSFACEAGSVATFYTDGDTFEPTIGDRISLDSDGTPLIDGGSWWYKFNNSSFSIQIGSNSIILAISLCDS